MQDCFFISKLGLYDLQSQSESTSFRNGYEAEALRSMKLHGPLIKEITTVGRSVERKSREPMSQVIVNCFLKW